jgi:hypothetical protein
MREDSQVLYERCTFFFFFILSSSFSCVGEIEPTIRAADNALPTASAGENKKIFKAASVKYVVTRAAHGPHLGAIEVVHANCAGR